MIPEELQVMSAEFPVTLKLCPLVGAGQAAGVEKVIGPSHVETPLLSQSICT
ncbi:MAG: Uncharacterised protein [Flavobacteriia bacterium]|nr:MAG: Uncharacterised protein [Flavobacteriia bacterium]